MKKKLLGMFAMFLFGGFMLTGTAQAQIASDAKTFTLTVPDAYRWVTDVPATQAFAVFTSADFNATVNNTGTSAEHKVLVSDGTLDGSGGTNHYLYMETNSEAQAQGQTYQIDIATAEGSTATFTSPTVINIVDTDGGADIDVNVLLKDHTYASTPTLGGAWPATGSGPNISFAGSGIAGNWLSVTGGGSAAALSLGLDFDESTLGYDDTVGSSDQSIGFTLTFTVLGVQ